MPFITEKDHIIRDLTNLIDSLTESEIEKLKDPEELQKYCAEKITRTIRNNKQYLFEIFMSTQT